MMDGLTLILLLLGLMIALLGLLLILRPAAARRLTLPLRQALPGIHTSVRIERYYYRHHRITGPLTIAGGGLLLLTGWTGWGAAAANGGADWLWVDILRLFFAVAGVAVTAIGITVTVRPSALKRLEAWANQPVSRETLLNPLQRVRGGLLEWTHAKPRLIGLAAVGGGLVLVLRALI